MLARNQLFFWASNAHWPRQLTIIISETGRALFADLPTTALLAAGGIAAGTSRAQSREDAYYRLGASPLAHHAHSHVRTLICFAFFPTDFRGKGRLLADYSWKECIELRDLLFQTGLLLSLVRATTYSIAIIYFDSVLWGSTSPHLTHFYNSLSLLYILIFRVTYAGFYITHSGTFSLPDDAVDRQKFETRKITVTQGLSWIVPLATRLATER